MRSLSFANGDHHKESTIGLITVNGILAWLIYQGMVYYNEVLIGESNFKLNSGHGINY